MRRPAAVIDRREAQIHGERTRAAESDFLSPIAAGCNAIQVTRRQDVADPDADLGTGTPLPGLVGQRRIDVDLIAFLEVQARQCTSLELDGVLGVEAA